MPPVSHHPQPDGRFFAEDTHICTTPANIISHPNSCDETAYPIAGQNQYAKPQRTIAIPNTSTIHQYLVEPNKFKIEVFIK